MFKKIYVEITNSCNLDCSFCIKNKRQTKFMDKEQFELILKKLQSKTKYLYFHVLGEPLMHPNINEYIDLASKDFFINITTNGYLIERIKSNNIRQLNISLHSFDDKYNISLKDYMNNIFKIVDKLTNTYISFRLWTKSKYTEEIIRTLNNHYKKTYKYETLEKNNILDQNIFLNKEQEFIWPDLNNDYFNEQGTCYGLKDHIGVLVDGTVIPCCLDSIGMIKLGNIFNQDINQILDSDRCTNMIEGFKNNRKVEELCKKCKFLN